MHFWAYPVTLIVQLRIVQSVHNVPQQMAINVPENHFNGAYKMSEKKIDVLGQLVLVLVGVEKRNKLSSGEPEVHDEKDHNGVKLVQKTNGFVWGARRPEPRAFQNPSVYREKVVGVHLRYFHHVAHFWKRRDYFQVF